MNDLKSLQSMAPNSPSSNTRFSRHTIAVMGCVLLLLTACSTAPRNDRVAAGFKSVPARLTVEQANDVTLMAIGLVGTPYRYGGNTPASGFDCSGLIRYVYKEGSGVPAPRSVSALVDWGQPVSEDSVRTGDLAIFGRGNNATHAGIYVGEGRFVHAPSSGGEVRLDQLKSKYWSTQQVAFRRP
jgi:cell wall-associated NlpC family hydrolase